MHDSGQLNLPGETLERMVTRVNQRAGRRNACILLQLKKNMPRQNFPLAADKDAGPLDHVPQFPDIPWPVVILKNLERFSA
jgi:hypothetical protein